MRDVAAVLVNFNSGRLCDSAVRSLRAQRFPGRGGGAGSLQIVVVDNASPQDQRPWLEPLAAQGAEVVFHDRNEGYARGMNLGLGLVDAEFVLIMNPDVLVLKGALAALLDALRRDPGIGVAGPHGFLDPELFVRLPPNDLPTLAAHVVESLGRVHPAVARRAAAARARRFLAGWSATAPRSMDMISGFAMFLRTAVARRFGPFDPGFPFYFEDADLCRRVTRAGLRLALVPGARMIHFFDQSARSVRAEVEAKYHASRAWYYRKHGGALGARLFAWAEGYARRFGARGEGWRFAEPEDLGQVEEPPRLAWPGARPAVLEIATDPAFLFCGGHLLDGDSITFPKRTWDFLEATRWYVRVLDRAGARLLRYVTFEKIPHSTGPVTLDEFRAIRPEDAP